MKTPETLNPLQLTFENRLVWRPWNALTPLRAAAELTS